MKNIHLVAHSKRCLASIVIPFILALISTYVNAQQLFTLLPSEKTSIEFQNKIFEDGKINMLTYEYLYNGGGVALGDFNNDNLIDIYFTGSMIENKLYINKGNMKFEDITKSAGVGTEAGMSSGVTLVDINQDGYLDIYVCKSASSSPEDRRNILFVNNGDLTFTDKAKEYGLADESFSTQAYFYDFDLDGDLDMYLVNHPSHMRDAKKVYLAYNDVGQLVLDEDTLRQYVSDRYYENVQGKYIDKTIKAGIGNYAYGLSAIVADFNNDHYPDIYVCNDYIKPDYLYINNKNGTFTNQFNQYFKHSSSSSMGSEFADINNDGLLDLITVDMLAEDHPRQKMLKTTSNYDHFFKNVKYGLEYQYAKNCLHLNNGNGSFSEIGYFAGVSFTDWSWAVILNDFDLDAHKDLYITNGYLRDVIDMDYVKYKADSVVKEIKNMKTPEQIQKLFSVIPSVKTSNYFFHNTGKLVFKNLTTEAGLYHLTWSNGAAIADLDNDGDADIVVNNFFEPASIFKNNAVESRLGNYCKLILKGDKANPQALGALVHIKTPDGITQTFHQMPTRGYLSNHEAAIITGLGNNTNAEVSVIWPGGKSQSKQYIEANKTILIEKTKTEPLTTNIEKKTLFSNLTQQAAIKHTHKENEYIDFKLEPLLPRQLSKTGPALAVGDLNGDGKEDFFVGGAKGEEAAIYIQSQNGKFEKINSPILTANKAFEDTQAEIIDIDQDGDLDIIVASGGNDYPNNMKMYPIRIYRNDGNNIWNDASSLLPDEVKISAGALACVDYNQDGLVDLFIGARSVPGHYGRIPRSYLLQNNKSGFVIIKNPVLDSIGMVTGATWADINNNGFPDLILVGDWMPVSIFTNEQGKLSNKPIQMKDKSGWWNTVHAQDLDKDGKIDLVLGNLGLNTRYKGNKPFPLTMVVSDFDKNGSTDAVISIYQNNKSTPMAIRDNLLDQMVYLKKKFLRYKTYSTATIQDIFTAEQLAEALHLEANDMVSQVLYNEGNLQFTSKYLPKEAQLFPVKSILTHDINNDGITDLLLAGNEYATEVETGRIDAGIGLCLIGSAERKFTALSVKESGFFTPGDVKKLRKIMIENQLHVLVGRNNDSMLLLRKD